MSTSYADPAIVLSLALSEGSLSEVQQQLSSCLRKAVDHTKPEFERLELFLHESLGKSQVGTQLFDNLEKALRSMSKGNFTQPLLDSLKKLEQEYQRLGEAAYASVAKQAQAIAFHGLHKGMSPAEVNLRSGRGWDTTPQPNMIGGFTSWQAEQAETERIQAIQRQGSSAWRQVHEYEHEEQMLREKAKNATFTPHKWNDEYLDNTGEKYVQIMTDVHKYDAFLAKHSSHYQNRHTTDSADLEGNQRFKEFLMYGDEAIQSPLVHEGFALADGNHRYSTFRNLGLDQIPMTVPEHLADEFRKRFGTDAEKSSAAQGRWNNAWRHAHHFEQEDSDYARIKANKEHNAIEDAKMAEWHNQQSAAAYNRNRDPYGNNADTKFQDTERLRQNNAEVERRILDDEQRYHESRKQLHQQEWQDSKDERRLNARFKNLDANAEKERLEAIRQMGHNAWRHAHRFEQEEESIASRRMSVEGAHRLRGQMMQVGYGVDDFIQSYQTMGFAGGMRAMSNNATALAMMSIRNPMAAAGTVIGISALTAALPTLVKTIWGTDVEHLKQSAEGKYDSFAHPLGAARRSEGTIGALHQQMTEFTNLRDTIEEDKDLRQKAHDTLKSYGLRYVKNSWFNSPQNTYSTVVGGKAGAEVDAATKWLDADTAAGTTKQDKLNKLWSNMEKLRESAKLEQRQESSSFSFGRINDSEKFMATSRREYEETLKKEAEFRKKQIAERGGSPEHIKAQQELVNIELQGQLVQKEKNSLTVMENNRIRAAYQRNSQMDATSFNDPIRQIQQILLNKRDELVRRKDAGLLKSDQMDDLYERYKDAAEKQKDRIARDFGFEAMGGMDPLTALRLKHQDANDRLQEGMRTNPRDKDRYQQMIDANNAGFKKQNAELMTDLTNQFKIGSPIGKIADHFAKEAEKLEQMLVNNPNMPQADKDNLINNLEKSWTLANREANRPSGHERFAGDAITVGSGHDRELQSRMTSTFQLNPDNEFKKQSLADFKEMLKALSSIDSKLQMALLGL